PAIAADEASRIAFPDRKSLQPRADTAAAASPVNETRRKALCRWRALLYGFGVDIHHTQTGVEKAALGELHRSSDLDRPLWRELIYSSVRGGKTQMGRVLRMAAV